MSIQKEPTTLDYLIEYFDIKEGYKVQQYRENHREFMVIFYTGGWGDIAKQCHIKLQEFFIGDGLYIYADYCESLKTLYIVYRII